MTNDNEPLCTALKAAWEAIGVSPTPYDRKAAFDYARFLLSAGYRVTDAADLAVRAQAGRLAGKAFPLEDPPWKAT
jgi:hypothetical protein